jgi:hypothetical protein
MNIAQKLDDDIRIVILRPSKLEYSIYQQNVPGKTLGIALGF